MKARGVALRTVKGGVPQGMTIAGEGCEGVSHRRSEVRNVLGRASSKCKGPEVQMHLMSKICAESQEQKLEQHEPRECG